MDIMFPEIVLVVPPSMSAFGIVHAAMLAMDKHKVQHNLLQQYKLECLDAAHEKDRDKVLSITREWVTVTA
jgi:hypothetical protein